MWLCRVPKSACARKRRQRLPDFEDALPARIQESAKCSCFSCVITPWKWRIPANEPGQPDEKKTTPLSQNMEPERNPNPEREPEQSTELAVPSLQPEAATTPTDVHPRVFVRPSPRWSARHCGIVISGDRQKQINPSTSCRRADENAGVEHLVPSGISITISACLRTNPRPFWIHRCPIP